MAFWELQEAKVCKASFHSNNCLVGAERVQHAVWCTKDGSNSPPFQRGEAHLVASSMLNEYSRLMWRCATRGSMGVTT
jgi:hypothetical protein